MPNLFEINQVLHIFMERFTWGYLII